MMNDQFLARGIPAVYASDKDTLSQGGNKERRI